MILREQIELTARGPRPGRPETRRIQMQRAIIVQLEALAREVEALGDELGEQSFPALAHAECAVVVAAAARVALR